MSVARKLDKISEREFRFTEDDFQKIRTFVKEQTGISLSDAKKDMVYGRLTRRLRQLNIHSFKEYFSYAKSGNPDELGHFINAITTNLTAFFRESHHMDYLGETVISALMVKNAPQRMRIWSAGCSTGEEPYSLAMTLLESALKLSMWDVKILATDLDTNVLQNAQRGIYDEQRIEGLSKQRRNKWFFAGQGEHQGQVRIDDTVKQLVTFNQLNLMHHWPMQGLFDVIFCRNVVIYFDKATQRVLFDRFANILKPDGFLFVGHSESLFNVTDRFELLGNTIYRLKS